MGQYSDVFSTGAENGEICGVSRIGVWETEIELGVFSLCSTAHDTRRSNLRGGPGNHFPIITIKTEHPHSSRTDIHDEIKTGSRKKSAMIRDVSAGDHSGDNERTGKYAVTYVPELLHRIYERQMPRLHVHKV